MANEEHLAKLREGVEVWNAWREANSDVTPDLREADLRRAHLSRMNLRKADLRGVHLHEADLRGAHLHEADLRRAHLGGADLERADLVFANLSGANFGGANLTGAELSGANIRNAGLIAAYLDGADLSGAYLDGADLSGAYLDGADLSETSLSEANLSWANLREANLREANLRNADLSEADLGYTTLANVDLSECMGLETVKHEGPSSLGIDTIYKSGGHIPDVFLRGCGVPDDLIDYIHSIAGAIQFYSCFISYSTKDEEFAERLHADLRAKGLRVWFAQEDIKGGRKLHEQIPEAIRHSDKLLLVLSPHSMESEWVKTEVYHARQDEVRSNKRKLFPISLVPFENIRQWSAFDADVGKDMAREVREYFIPDFSNWKNHDAYQKAFERLLRDLKASEEKKDE